MIPPLRPSMFPRTTEWTTSFEQWYQPLGNDFTTRQLLCGRGFLARKSDRIIALVLSNVADAGVFVVQGGYPELPFSTCSCVVPGPPYPRCTTPPAFLVLWQCLSLTEPLVLTLGSKQESVITIVFATPSLFVQLVPCKSCNTVFWYYMQSRGSRMYSQLVPCPPTYEFLYCLLVFV